jgi:hypothetical protein
MAVDAESPSVKTEERIVSPMVNKMAGKASAVAVDGGSTLRVLMR